MLDYWCRAQR
ncbi:unnamed protein product [Linum tenue]|uniref:Uncharacterized protein n=1 Tax=Linum tenue TaxID=586396 RepID=A0AAV0LM17_9ROSI|nr:unnamed protein product [Linum tenue]CAI0435609.1 unnamed protein product [Linum tenue]